MQLSFILKALFLSCLAALGSCTCRCPSLDRLKCIKTPHEIALEQQPQEKFYKGYDSDRGKAGGLKSISFEDQSFDLNNVNLTRTEQNARILKKFPKVRIIIEGYGDGTGEVEKDLELAKLRIVSVWRWLLKLGVANKRMTYRKRSSLKPSKKVDPDLPSPKTHRVNFIIKNFDG